MAALFHRGRSLYRLLRILFVLAVAVVVLTIVAVHFNLRIAIVKQLIREPDGLKTFIGLTNKTYEERTLHEEAKALMTSQPQQLQELNGSRAESKVDPEEENLITGKEHNVAFKLANVKKGSFIMKRFHNLVLSICNHTTVSLVFYLFADQSGREASKEDFEQARSVCKYGFKMKYYDINSMLSGQMATIKQVKESTQDALGMGRHPLFFLPIVLHQILPSFIYRLILFDSDFYFQADIKDLFAHFDSFTEDNCFGAVYVQQPTYRFACRNYRATHPDTRLGGSPPDGVPGYNGGLIMLHLKNLRKSKLYNVILAENSVKKYAEKYQFRNSLGEQDFFILLDMEHHELFHVLPCSWNRQTTYYLGDKSYVNVYDSYHKCPDPIFAYHGNARAKMPNE